jgi:hypothetical protein
MPNEATASIDYRDDYQALRRRVRELFEERRDAGVWPRKQDGTFTKAGADMSFDWLLGIHVGLTLTGSENGLGPMVLLASVRGVDDATTIRESSK